jgi:predicted outer membrane repeat protein
LDVKSCIFAGSQAGEWGGAVYLKDFEATFNDCYFVDSIAQSGGALLLSRGAVTLNGGLIYGNRSIGGDGLDMGGGIACSDTTATIENCTIERNSADGFAGTGGGIAFYGGDQSNTHLVKNCLITDNSATVEGGAISSEQMIYTTLEVQNCTFNENSAGSFGGAVFCDWTASAQIIDSIFADCDSHAIFEEDVNDAIVEYCLFYNNRDGDYGFYDPGASLIYTFDGSDLDPGNINADPNFVGGPLGDYYYLDQDVSPAVDTGSGDADNPNIGMDIYTTDPNGSLDVNEVDRGYHYRDACDIPQYQLTLTVTGGLGTVEPTRPSQYIDYDPNTNSYTYYAGTMVILTAEPEGIYRVAKWTGTINDASTANTNIVVMLADRDVTVEFRKRKTILFGEDPNYPTIQDAIDDAVDGDMIILTEGTYTPAYPFAHLTINRAITLSGAHPGDANCAENTVLNNYTISIFYPEAEGAIIDTITIRSGWMNIFNSSPIVRNCIFDGCRKYGGDGITITDPIPLDGTDGGSALGGAITMYGSSPDIQNCVFRNCSVTGGDGAPGADREIYGCDGGWAGKGYGGAIYIDAYSVPTVIDCSFDNCFAQGGNGGDGGNGTGTAIQGGRGGNWEWTNFEPEPNDINDPNYFGPFWWWDGWYWEYGWYYLEYGPALYFPYEDYWRYSGYGGAIYCESLGSPQFINCTFTNNHSYGGLSGTGGEPTWAMGWPVPDRDLNIENFGGSIYVRDGSPEFINCSISDSSADTSLVQVPTDAIVSYGGAVCVEDSSAKFMDCTVTNSEASRGGGMCWFNSDVTITDCDLADSRAYQGGGLYTAGSTGTITGSTFVGNEASDAPVPEPNDPNLPFDIGDILGSGGGYYCWKSGVWVTDSVFSENRATASGGGIYFGGSSQEASAEPVLHNSLVINNLASRDGGGISSNWHVEPTISNCTIVGNEATGALAYGGGLYGSFGSYTTVVDGIIWDNKGIRGSQIAVGTGAIYEPERRSTIDISYSDIQGYVEPTESIDVVFAIDTTASMWDDIDAVKEAAAEIVNGITRRRKLSTG